MAINWFEGGRRIFAILCGLIFFGGAIVALQGGGDDKIIFETSSPSERLRWTIKECEYPDYEKAWRKQYEFSPGDTRIVAACFRANANGMIEYIKRVPVSTNSKSLKWEIQKLEDYPFSIAVDEYANARMKYFYLEKSETDKIRKGLWRISVSRFSERISEVFGWVLLIIFGTWVVSSGIGWLIRGFAGIPNGKDFRADELNNTSLENRISLKWILFTCIVIWVLMIVAWVTSNAVSTDSFLFDDLFKTLIQFIGTAFLLVFAFFAFALGGIGLRNVIDIASGRPAREWSENKLLGSYAIANFVLVISVASFLNVYTRFGDWISALDNWSRDNGFADSATVGLFIVCLLWPWGPLLAARRALGRP